MQKSLRSPRHMRLQAVLAETRRSRRMTQQSLADRLGRPQSFVAKYEGGERRLDVIEFIDIAEALTTDPCTLLRRLRGGGEES